MENDIYFGCSLICVVGCGRGRWNCCHVSWYSECVHFVCKFPSIHFWMSSDTEPTPQTKQHDNCSLGCVLQLLDLKIL